MSFMLTVNYAECRKEAHYAECHNAECRYAECHYAECHYAEFCGALGCSFYQLFKGLFQTF
jgi:hypothetical protein